MIFGQPIIRMVSGDATNFRRLPPESSVLIARYWVAGLDDVYPRWTYLGYGFSCERFGRHARSCWIVGRLCPSTYPYHVLRNYGSLCTLCLLPEILGASNPFLTIHQLATSSAEVRGKQCALHCGRPSNYRVHRCQTTAKKAMRSLSVMADVIWILCLVLSTPTWSGQLKLTEIVGLATAVNIGGRIKFLKWWSVYCTSLNNFSFRENLM